MKSLQGIVVILSLAMCNTVLAWAPGTHLYFAKEVLHFGHLLPSSLFALLTQYRTDFLYGSIAADITLGKAYIDYIYNCHNFDVGLNLLTHCNTPAARAFVYGYLSHLAADTVSHNFFVPYQNVSHFQGPRIRHAYWEVRLDCYFGDRVWHEIEAIVNNPRSHGHDRLLDGALKDTVFSFRTNKILFSSMLAIQRLKRWNQFVHGVNQLSAKQFNPQHLSEYNRLAVSAIIRFFNEGKNSRVYLVDPTGAKTFEEVVRIKKMLKTLKRKGRLSVEMHEEECVRFRSHVRKLYFDQFPVEAKHFNPSLHLKI